MRKNKSILLVGTLLVLVAMAAASGWFLVVHAPEKADVIMVLAGETDARPALGLKLLEQGYAPRLILNVPAEAKIYQWTQPELARKYVDGLPQAASIAVCPIHGQSTERRITRCRRMPSTSDGTQRVAGYLRLPH